MSAGKEIVDQLRRHKGQAAPVEASASGDRTRVRVRAQQVDEIGARLDEVEAESPPLGPGGAERWAREFAERARYLLEPLDVIEVDKQENEAIARSNPPDRSGDAIDYYEAHVSGTGRAVVRRYRYDRQNRTRQQTPMDLSHEQIRRLVDDIDASRP